MNVPVDILTVGKSRDFLFCSKTPLFSILVKANSKLLIFPNH
jgi:ribosomal protein L11